MILICKNELTYNSDILLFKGFSYECMPHGNLHNIYIIRCKNTILYFNDGLEYKDIRYLWNYFYTEKEIRKMKLDGLSGRLL